MNATGPRGHSSSLDKQRPTPKKASTDSANSAVEFPDILVSRGAGVSWRQCKVSKPQQTKQSSWAKDTSHRFWSRHLRLHWRMLVKACADMSMPTPIPRDVGRRFVHGQCARLADDGKSLSCCWLTIQQASAGTKHAVFSGARAISGNRQVQRHICDQRT